MNIESMIEILSVVCGVLALLGVAAGEFMVTMAGAVMMIAGLGIGLCCMDEEELGLTGNDDDSGIDAPEGDE